MKKIAIIVAAGTGSRMGSLVPKQFMLVNDKPVLYYTLRSFLESYEDMHVILVVPAEYMEEGEGLVNEYFDRSRIRLTAGGDTRFQSVKNGLALVEKDSIVFVHDGVRCLLTSTLIHRCYEAAVETGSAIPAIVVKDSIRLLHEHGSEVLDRNNVMLIQTPQTFQSKIITVAFQTEYKEEFTDEATVVEAYGVTIAIVEGEENNIKITRPVDLLVAERLIQEREPTPNP